jgi:hypothetical protein
MAGPPGQDGCCAQCNNIKKRWEIGLAQTQDGGCVKEQMAGPPGQDGCRAQCNNIKKRWEIGLAQTQDGGCVKKHGGPPSKMAAARNVTILKNGKSYGQLRRKMAAVRDVRTKWPPRAM